MNITILIIMKKNNYWIYRLQKGLWQEDKKIAMVTRWSTNRIIAGRFEKYVMYKGYLTVDNKIITHVAAKITVLL